MGMRAMATGRSSVESRSCMQYAVLLVEGCGKSQPGETSILLTVGAVERGSSHHTRSAPSCRKSMASTPPFSSHCEMRPLCAPSPACSTGIAATPRAAIEYRYTRCRRSKLTKRSPARGSVSLVAARLSASCRSSIVSASIPTSGLPSMFSSWPVVTLLIAISHPFLSVSNLPVTSVALSDTATNCSSDGTLWLSAVEMELAGTG
mmetsp:Transcript_12623/g.20022  ORF Transcript_12623/g.20022 Transcript_12623/m.20022 type:complete len:205 (+) Transcript_12623:1070-1684(+)